MKNSTDITDDVLRHYVEAIVVATNACMVVVPAILVADSLLSGAVEVLRKNFGTAEAVDHLRRAIVEIETQNPPETVN